MSCGEGRGLLVLHHIGVGGVGAQLGPRGDVSGVFVMKKTRFPETFTRPTRSFSALFTPTVYLKVAVIAILFT